MASLLGNIFNYASRPVRDLIELGNIVGTGLGVKRVQSPEYSMEQLRSFADQGGSSAFLARPEQRRYAQDLGESQKAFEKVTSYKPIALQGNEMEGLLDYDRALKDAAIVGSFMMPGIGSGLGGALATGAIGGAMGGYGGSRRGEELQSTLTGAGVGTAFGALGYGLGKLAQSVQKTKVNPKMIQGSASRAGMSPEQFKQSSAKLLQDMSDAGFDVSSPKKIANNYEAFLKGTGNKTSRISSLTQGTPNLSQIEDIYNANIEFLGDGKGVTGKFKSLTENLLGKSNATYDDVLQYKMNVDKLGGGFDKVQKSGKPLLAQLMKEIRDESRSVISGNPVLDDILQSYSNALGLKDVVLKNPEITSKIGIGGIFPIKMSANMRPIQDALRGGGSVSKATGSLLGRGIEQISKGLTGQGIISLPGSLAGIGAMESGQEQQPQVQEQESSQIPFIDPTTGFVNIPEIGTSQGVSSVASGGISVQDALAQAYQMMPGASESELMSLARMLMSQGGTSTVTASGRQAEADAQAALDQLDRISASIEEDSELFGPIRGTAGSVTPLGGVATKSLNAEIKLAKQIIGKFLEGGVLRKEDEDKYNKILPQVTDQLPVAKAKLNYLREELTNRLNRYRQSGYAGYGTSGGSTGSSISNDYDSWMQ